MVEDILFTIYETRDLDCLTKRIKKDEKGKIKKIPAGNTLKALQHKIEVKNIKEFCDVIDSLNDESSDLGKKAAFGYGVFDDDENIVLTKDKKKTKYLDDPQITARTKENVKYSEESAGIVMLDHDEGNQKLDELRDVLIEIFPNLADVQMAGYHSTGSFIYDENGKVLVGEKGHKIYFPISIAADIKDFAEYLKVKLWLSGKGKIVISESGSKLEKTLFDMSVFSPERFDFVAGAVCEDGLSQHRPNRIIWNESENNTGHFVFDKEQYHLSALDVVKYKSLVSEAKEAKNEEAKAVRELFIDKRAKEHSEKLNVSYADARKIVVKSVVSRELDYDFLLYYYKNGKEYYITVGEILSNVAAWIGVPFCDPIEKDYNNNHSVAMVLRSKDGNAFIHSFAHGGKVYFMSGKKSVNIDKQDDKTINKCYEVLDETGSYFYSAEMDALVNIDISKNKAVLDPLNVARTRKHLQDIIDFVKVDYDEKKKTTKFDKTNPPDRVVEGVFHNTKNNLKKIEGVSNLPLIRADFSIFCRNGYDTETGIYLHTTETFEAIENPSNNDLKNALRLVLSPFREYKFDNKPLSDSILLACMFGVLTNNSVPKRPYLLTTAFEQGSGKTKICEVFGVMLEGDHKVITDGLEIGNEEEIEKKLCSKLRTKPSYVIWDNLPENKIIDSAVLARVVLSPTPAFRVLGSSKMIECPNKTFQMFSGNRIGISGDMERRTFVLHINPQSDNPRNIKYTFEPVEYTTKNRNQIINAMLMLIAAYKKAGCPIVANNPIASFEEWDKFNRQIVLWISKQSWCDVALTDVEESLVENFNNSDSRNRDNEFAYSLYDMFEDRDFSAYSLINKLTNDDGEFITNTRDYLKAFLKDNWNNTRSVGKSFLKPMIGRVFERDTTRIVLEVCVDKKRGNKYHFVVAGKKPNVRLGCVDNVVQLDKTRLSQLS